MKLYNNISTELSATLTKRYSTSFTLGIKLLDKKFHEPIYSIYGFVRVADEIVDTFHHVDQRKMLDDFTTETWKAIDSGISSNPILHSFQMVYHKYGFTPDLVNSFLKSMKMDLDQKQYENELYREYIYGSAEVVGLMCLKVFCEGDKNKYDSLEEYARSLGSAFQKVNFLRDLQSDYVERGRVYFPGTSISSFDNDAKSKIEHDIDVDFENALIGICKLPKGAKLGVYLAYAYFKALLEKIKHTSVNGVKENRIRIPNGKKYWLLMKSYMKYRIEGI